jgi:polyisoprenoid-binding protein YceI
MRHVAVLLLAAPVLDARAYSIRPAAGSSILLEIYKTGLMSGKKHDIYFERYQGTLQYDAAAPERSKVELTIETGSLAVKDTWINESKRRDVREHAVGTEGLDVARHPSMSFTSGAITRKPDGSFDVSGTLTICGIAKPLMISVTVKPSGAGLMLGGKARVLLRDFGIKPPKAALGAIGTKNEMDVTFTVTALP